MDVYFTQQIDNSRVVRIDDPRRRREQRFGLFAGGLLFILLFGWAWQRYAMVQLGYQLEHTRQQQVIVAQYNEQLRLQEADLARPDRITAVALNLGMEPARADQFLAMDEVPGALGAPVVAASNTTPVRRLGTGNERQ